RSRTDSLRILQDLRAGMGAALVPLGGIGEETAGYKGYGLATVVEILSAALQSGSYLSMLVGEKNGVPTRPMLGHFFIAIDVSAFTDESAFRKTVGDILRTLRKSAKMPGKSRILTAGEKEYLTWMERKDRGIPIDRNLRRDILAMHSELGLSVELLPIAPRESA
ncbi:MAG: Ldh family oxidoreductase, partial [Firmicutes bacterium]|nr:Ldh family oxidoreductase [Bacillota bacterium]